MLRLLKISGSSLSPVYQEGDFVLVSKIPFLVRPPKVGDVVVFRRAPYGLLIKLVERVLPDGKLWVAGTRPVSVDSYEFGPVKREDLEGKVIVHFKKQRANVSRKDA
jgi:signal peptidase I